jgi:hypothetical protein
MISGTYVGNLLYKYVRVCGGGGGGLFVLVLSKTHLHVCDHFFTNAKKTPVSERDQASLAFQWLTVIALSLLAEPGEKSLAFAGVSIATVGCKPATAVQAEHAGINTFHADSDGSSQPR